MRSSIEEAEYDFYAALTRAAASDHAGDEARVAHLAALQTHHGRITRWAEHCPENFANRRALIGAERARLEGRPLDAQRLYEEAVQSARAYGFTQNEALASELAGTWYAACGL